VKAIHVQHLEVPVSAHKILHIDKLSYWVQI